MKLYTEEQVNKAMLDYIQGIPRIKIFNSLTPIEIPDSMEIYHRMHELKINDINQRNAFYLGSHFVIDKIKKFRL